MGLNSTCAWMYVYLLSVLSFVGNAMQLPSPLSKSKWLQQRIRNAESGRQLTVEVDSCNFEDFIAVWLRILFFCYMILCHWLTYHPHLQVQMQNCRPLKVKAAQSLKVLECWLPSDASYPRTVMPCTSNGLISSVKPKSSRLGVKDIFWHFTNVSKQQDHKCI